MTRAGDIRLGRTFFARPTEIVARDLLGTRLETSIDGLITGGTIVETEAYLGQGDLSCHAAFLSEGRRILACDPGTIYIYRCYGIHHMFNIVAKDEPHQRHGAVLVRAIEPHTGIEVMAGRRHTASVRALCSGPGKLCQALAIDSSINECPVGETDTLQIFATEIEPEIRISPRIGITRSAELMLRFFIVNNPFVSGSKRFNSVEYGATSCPATVEKSDST